MEHTITMELTRHVYENNKTMTNAAGFIASATYKYEGETEGRRAASGFRKSVLDVLDDALAYLLDSLARSYDTATVTITLPAGYTAADVKQVTDKYALEEQFTAITIA